MGYVASKAREGTLLSLKHFFKF